MERSFANSLFSDPEDWLCEKCKGIDVDHVFKRQVEAKSGLGELVALLGPLDSLSISNSQMFFVPILRSLAD